MTTARAGLQETPSQYKHFFLANQYKHKLAVTYHKSHTYIHTYCMLCPHPIHTWQYVDTCVWCIMDGVRVTSYMSWHRYIERKRKYNGRLNLNMSLLLAWHFDPDDLNRRFFLFTPLYYPIKLYYNVILVWGPL